LTRESSGQKKSRLGAATPYSATTTNQPYVVPVIKLTQEAAASMVGTGTADDPYRLP